MRKVHFEHRISMEAAIGSRKATLGELERSHMKARLLIHENNGTLR